MWWLNLIRQFAATYGVHYAKTLALAFKRALEKTGHSTTINFENLGNMSMRKAKGMSIEEAREVLMVGRNASVEEVERNFKRLFDMNDPMNGGSFYL